MVQGLISLKFWQIHPNRINSREIRIQVTFLVAILHNLSWFYEIYLNHSFLLKFDLFLESKRTKFSTELLTINKKIKEMLFQKVIANNNLLLVTWKWYVANIKLLWLLVSNYKVKDIYISATKKNATKELAYVMIHNLRMYFILLIFYINFFFKCKI